MGVWLVNGKLLDGRSRLKNGHVRVADGKIAAISGEFPSEEALAGHEVLDVGGQWISAAFIDLHVHFREPGFEYKETIATGSASALRGGFATVAAMPNTRPPVDTADRVREVLEKGRAAKGAKVLTYGCITERQLGEKLTDMAAMADAGVFGFTDDGVGVQSAQMMKDGMTLARQVFKPIIAHCEDDTLVIGAAMHEGVFAKKHGLKGIPNESEAIHVGRDILLAEATGVHYHVCHVSTKQSVRLIRMAKKEGIRVTAEVCPHHLILTDEDIPGLDANWKMNPPLRSPEDRQALIGGLEDGTIDFIVTDHAPHSAEEKQKELLAAPFGIVGLETAFPLLYTNFVQSGKWSLSFLVNCLTTRPADAFGLNNGRLEVGYPADITVINLDSTRKVDPEKFASKGKNTPFTGEALTGWPSLTMVDGEVAWQDDSIASTQQGTV